MGTDSADGVVPKHTRKLVTPMMDREQRLAELATASRVWDNKNGENVTPGLIELCRDWIRPDFVMAEIGCFAGVSTEIFALFAAKVYAVDPWEKAGEKGYGAVSEAMLKDARQRFLAMAANYPHVHAHQGFSVEVAADFPDDSLDAVYLDGDHSDEAFCADARAWLPKLKPGGLLMGHDLGIVGGNLAKLGLPEPVRSYSESSFVVQIGKAE